eukprot:gene28167-34983_t
MSASNKNNTHYDTDKTALLLIDPYNDFMSEGGKLYDKIKESAEKNNIWKEGNYNDWKAMCPSQVIGDQVQVFACNTWGGDGFANTDLDLQLKQHGIQKIILVGFTANTCIESTAKWGMELGYHITLVTDATAAFSEEGMVAFHTNAPTYAHAIYTANEVIAQLKR